MPRKIFPSVMKCAVCGLAFLAGCSKKESQAPAPVNAAAPSPDQAAQAAVPKSPALATDLPDSIKATVASAHSAIQSKNYQQAVALMGELQTFSKQPLSQEQAAALGKQMQQLKQEFLVAEASGDPNATAALD